MQYLDITGKALAPGQRVAFARTRGGTLALGTLVSCRGNTVRVTLASNNHLVPLPYDAAKFVILADTEEPELPLHERVLTYLRTCLAEGRAFVGIREVCLGLGVPQAEVHLVRLALMTLVEEGEVAQAAWPPYVYTLA